MNKPQILADTSLLFGVEAYSDIEPELIAIYPEHYEELAVNKQRKKLKPDYARYHAMEGQGMLHIPTARNAAGALVGYMIFMVMQNPHYMDIRTAYNDIFFLRKAYRLGWNGILFFRFMLNSMKPRAVDEIYMGVKLHNDYGPILEYFDFAPIERIYTKLLDGSKNEGRS